MRKSNNKTKRKLRNRKKLKRVNVDNSEYQYQSLYQIYLHKLSMIRIKKL